MKKSLYLPSIFFTLFLIAIILVLGLAFSGCVRFVGTAGYQYQGEEDEPPKSKSFTLDTDEMVHSNRSEGSIEL